MNSNAQRQQTVEMEMSEQNLFAAVAVLKQVVSDLRSDRTVDDAKWVRVFASLDAVTQQIGSVSARIDRWERDGETERKSSEAERVRANTENAARDAKIAELANDLATFKQETALKIAEAKGAWRVIAVIGPVLSALGMAGLLHYLGWNGSGAAHP
jgi:hypothetical protein